MTRRKPAPKRKPIKTRIAHVCVKCGSAVATGVLICGICVGAAQAAPRPVEHKQGVVMQVSPPGGALRYYSPAGQGWPPIGSLDDHDMPEPGGTFWPGDAFAGTAITGTAQRVWPGDLQ